MTGPRTNRFAACLPRRGDWGHLLVLGLAYLAAHKLAYLLPVAGGVIAAVWPASGVALGALLLSPRRLWPALLAVTSVTNFTVEMFAGRNVLTELGFVLANLLETAGSAWLISRGSDRPVTFRRVSEVLALAAAAIGVNAVSAAVGAAATLLEPGRDFWSVYRTWWVVDGLGLLLLTPLLVSWLGPQSTPSPRRSWGATGEGLLILALGGVLVWLYFGTRWESLPARPSSYMLFIPLVWAALRLGPRGTTAVLTGLGLSEIVVAALGLGMAPLGGATRTEQIIWVQLCVATQCGLTLLTAASFAERRASEESLRASEARLRTLGDNLPDSMIYQVVREQDGTMRFAHVSAGIGRLNGITPEAVLANPAALYGQLLEADRGKVAAAEESSLQTMSVFDVVARLRREDGAVRWMHIRSQPRRLADGRIAWEGIETDITARRQMEESLAASEEKFSKAFRASPVAVSVTRLADGRIVDVNPALEAFLDYRREALLGRTTLELGIWANEEDRDRMLAELRGEGRVRDLDFTLRTRLGRLVTAQFSAELIDVDGERCVLTALADMTARRAAKDELRRVNRALRTISNCNQVMVRTADEPTLLRELCRIIVEDSGHKLAWVGYADRDPAKTVRLMAAVGEQRGYLESLRLTWADDERGRGPTGVAIRSGQPVVSHDFLSDPRLALWHEAGRQSGFRSSVALPLRSGGEVFGALSIYSGDVRAFDEQEVRLLVELADDLAFGIQALREREHKQAAEQEVRKLLVDAENSRAALLSILEDQRHGEEALRASEEQFRSAMENSPIGMALVATDGRWLSVNQSLCRMVGYPREEMLSSNFQALTHPDDLEADLTAVRELLTRTRETYEREKRYVHRTGRIVWVQLNATLLSRADGTPKHFIAQFQDITQRKHAEAERVRLVHNLGERVKELTALHRTSRLLQQERPFDLGVLQEMVAFLPSAWQHPEICAARVSFAGLTATSPGWQESPWSLGVEFRTRTGEVGAIRVVYREECPPADEGPFLAEERTLLQSLADMLTAHLDRLSAESSLRAVNRRYARHEAALSTLSRSYALRPEGLLAVLREILEVVARTLEVERVSVWTYNRPRTALLCLGLYEHSQPRHSQGAEMPRAGHESYFNAVDNADVVAAVDALRDPRTASLAPGYLEPLDIVSLLHAPIHARGNSTGVLCCEHLFSQRQWTPDEQTFAVAVANLVSMLFAQLEQQQLEAQLRHTQKLEALGTLAGGIAHDFNNILGAIISFTELARMDHPQDAELQENLGEVLKASNRATGLVRQILAFSRRQQQERKPMALAPVVREALQLMRSTLPVTIDIQAHLPDGLPPVLADPTQVHQVVMNLCTNAGHAMHGRRGRLSVTLDWVAASPGQSLAGAAAAGFLRLTVGDSGHGMDAATVQRIFDPFFTTKGPGEGTGLGLAVVHGIVQEHGGEIEVESQPGVGTTFRVLLPVAKPATNVAPPVAACLPAGRGQCILFVDDETALAEGARRLLGREGFEVLTQGRPEEALALVERDPHRFAAVLTDLTMPTMTGTELAQRIHRIHPRLPIFIMTGHAGDLTDEAVRTLGATELVLKPLDYPALARRLAGVLAGPDCPS